MPINEIVIKGAREHNLKNVDVTIPRDKLVVMTGLSGSGKSSLAFDTIYADGQRRYVESLSSYARMFLGQMDKPDVDSIEGLSPAISIDQKTTSKNPRSTVGTVTEIYDYLRLLYARIGVPHCPVCGREIRQQTVDQIVDKIMELDEGTKTQLLAPIVRGRKGEHTKELDRARKSGYVRVRIPSIIFGLVGMLFFVQKMNLQAGVLAGGLTLVVMILPTILRTTQESLKTVPQSYREGALGLGAGKWRMVRTVVLPNAIDGIVTGCILAVGRIVGESAALLYTAGFGLVLNDFFTALHSSSATLTVALYVYANERGETAVAFSIATILMLLNLSLSAR